MKVIPVVLCFMVGGSIMFFISFTWRASTRLAKGEKRWLTEKNFILLTHDMSIIMVRGELGTGSIPQATRQVCNCGAQEAERFQTHEAHSHLK